MKLDSQTLATLKNFAGINVNLVIEPGNVIRTLSPARTVFAKAELNDSFTKPVSIFDLNSFLQAATLFDDADLDFQDKFVHIKSADSRIKYWYCEPGLIQAAPNKEITIDETIFECELAQADINALFKVAAALASPEISFNATGGKATLVVGDRKNVTAHNYTKALGKSEKEFNAILRVENFKLLPGDYKVQVARKKSVGIVIFTNKNQSLTYWMMVDTDSKVE